MNAAGCSTLTLGSRRRSVVTRSSETWSATGSWPPLRDGPHGPERPSSDDADLRSSNSSTLTSPSTTSRLTCPLAGGDADGSRVRIA